MSTEPIYLVTDAGKPVTAFTTKDDMKAFLKRRRGTLKCPIRRRPTMREIVIDTETTGLDPLDGHRVVEPAAVSWLDSYLTILDYLV
jgi:DNA polymerase III epsilon subunit-like protein